MLAEVEQYLGIINDLRNQVRTIIAAAPADALNWRPLKGEEDHATNSLAIMAAHVAGSEHFWIAEVVGRRPPTRNRPAEFVTEVVDAAPLLERLDSVALETPTVLQELTAADLDETRQADERIVSVRWAILHIIDHTALHLGHMQLTYQLGQRGEPAPSPR